MNLKNLANDKNAYLFEGFVSKEKAQKQIEQEYEDNGFIGYAKVLDVHHVFAKWVRTDYNFGRKVDIYDICENFEAGTIPATLVDVYQNTWML